MNESAAIRVSEMSQAGESRRAAAELAYAAGLDENGRARLALIVTELASNLVKHSAGGEVFLRVLHQPGGMGVEVLTVDSGPGMMDVGACLKDGFSTVGTPGNGLGAVQRSADRFEIYAGAGSGAVMAARVMAQPKPSRPRPQAVFQPPPEFRIGAVCRPVFGEEECGDAWTIRYDEGRARVLVVDGLGHGPGAAEASNEAVEIFKAARRCTLTDLIQHLHTALRSTRGAALAAADIDLDRRSVRFAGVGNIGGYILSGDSAHGLMSHSGTVGHLFRRVQELDYDFPTGSLLVMHSDGVHTRWSLDGYPGLQHRDPALIAGVIYRDFKRERDDVTVLVIRGDEPIGSVEATPE